MAIKNPYTAQKEQLKRQIDLRENQLKTGKFGEQGTIIKEKQIASDKLRYEHLKQQEKKFNREH